MRKVFLVVLLVSSLLPLAYIIFITSQFHWVTSQDWFYGEVFRYAKTGGLLCLIACYGYLVKKNQNLSQSSKKNWYVALFLVGPISMPLYWFKNAWPAANKTLNSTPKSGAN